MQRATLLFELASKRTLESIGNLAVACDNNYLFEHRERRIKRNASANEAASMNIFIIQRNCKALRRLNDE